MRITPTLLTLAALATLAAPASAQRRTPFFGAGATAFDPEIGVVNSGEILDAQVAVSDDLKYVTINARASSSRLLALRDFTFVGSGIRRGFVGNGAGGDGDGDGDARGGGNAANGAPARAPDADADVDADDADDAARRDRARNRRGARQKPATAKNRAPEAQPAPPLPGGVLARPGMTLIGRLED